MKKKIAVIIPTRNRPKELGLLLDSIVMNRRKPDIVSIVSSGEGIDEIIEKYKLEINIHHEHSNIPGQINQRKIAISNLKKYYEINVFMDDDFVLNTNFFEIIEKELEDNNVDGVAFNLQKNQNKMLGKFMMSAGLMTRYGSKDKYVKWLNGVCVLSGRALQDCKFEDISHPYAAYEDAMWSYPLCKKYKMRFLNEHILSEQNNQNLRISKFDRIERHKTSLQCKIFFNFEHSEFSYRKLNLFFLIEALYLGLIFPYKFKFEKVTLILLNFKAIYFIIKNKKRLESTYAFRKELLTNKIF